MQQNEPFFEPILRYLRFKKISQHISSSPVIIVDIGCGPNAPFYDHLYKTGLQPIKYIGIDPLLNRSSQKNIKLIKSGISSKIKISSNYADYVFASAVLEHVDRPDILLNEMIRIAKTGGKIILTTPTPFAKWILEFLSYKLKLVSEREIREHKNYFTKKSLSELIKTKPIKSIEHKYFELYMNNLLCITK